MGPGFAWARPPNVTTPAFRFAPSPNGRLHLGHAYSALLNARLASAQAGRFLVRIEDIDPLRCKPAYETAILDDLHWLGLVWEEPVRRQSEHLADYRRAFDILRERGLVYPCFCTRGEIARATGAGQGRAVPRDPDGAPLYPGTCRHLAKAEVATRLGAGAPHAWRLDMAAALAVVAPPLAWPRFAPDSENGRIGAEPSRWGDAVIRRRDVPTSYHLSVVVDDALQGITHVVRGLDLEPATDLHVLLQGLLGVPTPAYHHHALIREPEGVKLSKSRGSPALADLRAAGVTAAEIRRRLGFPDP
jgi:glutamyl-Q tRNA(Asp) synthetase